MRILPPIAAIVAAVVLGMTSCGPRHSEDDGHEHGEPHAAEHEEHEDAGAESHADEHDHAHDSSHEDEGAELVRLDEHELREFGIELATAGPGVIREQTSLAGEIVLNPDRVAHVVSRAGGIGTEVRMSVGDLVRSGETLAFLDSPELAESKADYLSKAAQAALASTDLARAETIHANTIRLLQVIASHPDVEDLRREIEGLDIGASRGDLITAYAELRSAEAVYDREKTLFERQISSESEYLSAESELQKSLAAFLAVRDDLVFANRREFDAARRSNQVSEVSLQAAERRLHALGLDEEEVRAVANETDEQLVRYEIRAPIGGRIIERHLVRGESIEAGDQIFVIADLSSVWGELTLYQRDLGAIREGLAATIGGTHGLGDAEATIEYVSPILDEQTRTTTARVVLENASGFWRPGMFIRAELMAAERRKGVVVPRTAVQEIDGEPHVFVETAEGFEAREVRTGESDPDSVEIIVGLDPGERFVAVGGLALRVELNKAALEHAGHAH